MVNKCCYCLHPSYCLLLVNITEALLLCKFDLKHQNIETCCCFKQILLLFMRSALCLLCVLCQATLWLEPTERFEVTVFKDF